MKAIVQDGYGSPSDVLALRDLPTPTIDDKGVLVEVHAASVNALDWHVTKGPYLLRIMMGLRTPTDRVRGVDLAGRVVAVGKHVTRFQVGDEVFGGTDGSFAELAATTEDRLARKPAALTYGEAAALHVAGLTALQGLRDKARLQAGQRVLINGAGGGVGTYAVQIAKWIGAHVCAATRTESVDLARSLGADDVIDYRTGDFTRGNVRYDVIFDIGGNRPFRHLRRVIAPKGTIISVGAPQGRWFAPASRLLTAAALSPLVSGRITPFVSKNDHTGLALLAELAQSGHIRTVVDRQFALGETAEAISHVGAGRARGKVVITVRSA
ncbi:MAG TPA: NAD(P)-dependent alcohol dehydrogenase [Gemmatimonadaceae bacterium]|nr:NAD(P)-dependent alcohol dehydrogenase [Gemmatimonadaceae bacterium]